MTEEGKTGGRGCLFHGCLTLVVVLLAVGIGLFFGTRYAIKGVVTKFTSEQPTAIPQTSYTEAELKALGSNLAGRLSPVGDPADSAPIAITSRELNMLMGLNPTTDRLRERFHFEIEGDRVKGQVSIPLREFDVKLFKDRYLNGEATFKLTVANGQIDCRFDTLVINGAELPETVRASLSTQNLALKLNQSKEAVAILEKIAYVEVKDGKILAHLRTAEPATPSAP